MLKLTGLNSARRIAALSFAVAIAVQSSVYADMITSIGTDGPDGSSASIDGQNGQTVSADASNSTPDSDNLANATGGNGGMGFSFDSFGNGGNGGMAAPADRMGPPSSRSSSPWSRDHLAYGHGRQRGTGG